MRILVTGANGFIGSHVAAVLESAGHRVIRGVRGPEPPHGLHPHPETLACDLEKGAVEYVVETASRRALEQCCRQFTPKELAGVKAVPMDMWDPFIAAAKPHIPQGDPKIVFDHYPVTRTVTEAVDNVRKQEHKVFGGSGGTRA